MKIVAPSFFGIPMSRRLVLSKTERETLRRAAAILDAVDTLLQANGVDVDDYETRTDLINGWSICDMYAEADATYVPDAVVSA